MSAPLNGAGLFKINNADMVYIGTATTTISSANTNVQALHVNGGITVASGTSSFKGLSSDNGLTVSAGTTSVKGLSVSGDPEIIGSGGAAANVLTLKFTSTADYYGTILFMKSPAATPHRYIDCNTAAGVSQFRVNSQGNVFAQSTTITKADYAEYFEWSDGNPAGEDRRAMSVVLDDDSKIRLAAAHHDPNDIVGVVSVEPGVVGDGAWSEWPDKYLRDEFGVPLTRKVEKWEFDTPDGPQTCAPGDAFPQGADPATKRVVWVDEPVLNPAYDPNIEYVPREERREWAPVGLMGKLRVRVGQPVNPRWRLMKRLSDTMHLYLVR